MIGKTSEYEAMALCEKELWWYRSLHDMTLEKMKCYSVSRSATILDAGCGTGGMISKLLIEGYHNIAGFDYSADAVKHSSSTGLADIRLLDILSCNLAYDQGSFDVIICHDILCLLNRKDAVASLHNLTTLLKPGGLLMMNLPAGSAFRGTHDLAVGIKERYTKKSLKQLVGRSLHISETLYWPFLVSPSILLIRLIQRIKLIWSTAEHIESDVKMPQDFVNKLLLAISSWENKNLLFRPWGSSLFSVLQKG